MADKDININIRAGGTDDTKRKIDGVGGSTENLGKKTEQAGNKAQSGGKQIGGMGDKAQAAKVKMRALVTSLAGVTGGIGAIIALGVGLFKFFKKWLGWIKEVNEATRELTDSTKDLDRASKAMASQANIMGTEAGMEGSREDIKTIQKAGGTTYAMAGDVGVATHSAFGESGKRLTPGQLEIAGAVAGFAKRKDLSTTEAGQLLKLLSAMGVENVEEAKHRIKQLSTVQQESQAQTFGEFIGGATKAIIRRLAKGASVEGALSSYAKGLEMDTGDLAAEKMKQMSALLQNEKILQAMGKEYGMSEMDIRNMPFDPRIDMFSGWVSKHAATGAGEKYLLKSGLSAEQLGVAMTLYTENMRAVRAKFKGLAEGATAEQFDVEAEGYAKTTQGRIEALESAKERTAASATPDQRYGDAVLDLAEQEFETSKAHGKMPWAPVFRDTYLPRLLRRRYFKRMKALPEGPKKEAIREYFKTPGNNLDPFPVEDIGRLGRMLLDAEQQGDVMGPPVPADFHWRTREEQAQIDEILREVEDWKNRVLTPSQREAWDKGIEEYGESQEAGDLSEGQSRVINYNEHYDYSIHLNPVAGNAEDRLMGPPFDPYA